MESRSLHVAIYIWLAVALVLAAAGAMFLEGALRHKREAGILQIMDDRAAFNRHSLDPGGSVSTEQVGIDVAETLPPAGGMAYPNSWQRQMASGILFLSFVAVWLILGFAVFRGKLWRHPLLCSLVEPQASLSRANYKALVDYSLTGIYVSQDDKIVFANEEFARIHGYKREEILGMHALSLIHPEDRAMVAERMRKRYSGEEVSKEYQVRCLTKRGETIWVQRRNSLTQHNGRVAILGNEVDVTRHMLADAELAASERQLQLLADKLLELQEVERHRFANEIHENIAQSLSAIKLRVESFLEDIDARLSSNACQSLQPIVADVQHTVAEIRKMAARYRPLDLSHLGVIYTISWLCKQSMQKNPDIRIQTTIHSNESEIPDPLKIIIFRIVEQVLYSRSRQGRKITAHIALDSYPEQIKLTIGIQDREHDDRGIAQAPVENGLLIAALQRRCAAFGGTLESSINQHGDLSISASWPVYCKLRNRL